MTDKPGFKAFEKRIAELLRQNSQIPPAEVISLLRRAESNPGLDVEREMVLLRKKHAPKRRRS